MLAGQARPHSLATAATHAALQVLVQQLGFTAQMAATHGSQVMASFPPVWHTLWAQELAPG
jgi:hypothetical protein